MYPPVTSRAKMKKSLNLTPNATVIKTNRMICKTLQSRKKKTNTLRRFPSLMKTPKRTTSKSRTPQTRKKKTTTLRRFPSLKKMTRRATTHPKPQRGPGSSL